MTLVAREIGQAGFVTYLHQLRGLGVLSKSEILAWLQLHGAVVSLEPLLDDGETFDEAAVADLERELGET